MVMDNGWTGVLWIAVVLLLLLVWVFYAGYYFKRMQLLSHGRSRIVSYNGDVMATVNVVGIWVLSLVGLSLAITAAIARAAHLTIDVPTLLTTLGITVGYVGIKIGILYLLKYVFGFGETVFVEQMRIVTVVFCSLMAFVGLIFAYGDSLMTGAVLSLSLLVLGVIFEAYLLVKNFYTKISSLLYIFLYLCTLEILPLLVGAKLLVLMLN